MGVKVILKDLNFKAKAECVASFNTSVVSKVTLNHGRVTPPKIKAQLKRTRAKHLHWALNIYQNNNNNNTYFDSLKMQNVTSCNMKPLSLFACINGSYLNPQICLRNKLYIRKNACTCNSKKSNLQI